MKRNMVTAGFCVFCLLVTMGGCEPVEKVSSATVSFVRGDLNIQQIDYPIADVYDACLAAAKDLDLTVSEKEENALESQITAYDSSAEKVTFYMKRLTGETTSLKIRIGLTGDKTKSWAIYDQVEEHLK